MRNLGVIWGEGGVEGKEVREPLFKVRYSKILENSTFVRC